jgi:hypothetical protein
MTSKVKVLQFIQTKLVDNKIYVKALIEIVNSLMGSN